MQGSGRHHTSQNILSAVDRRCNEKERPRSVCDIVMRHPQQLLLAEGECRMPFLYMCVRSRMDARATQLSKLGRFMRRAQAECVGSFIYGRFGIACRTASWTGLQTPRARARLPSFAISKWFATFHQNAACCNTHKHVMHVGVGLVENQFPQFHN